jgi:glyoxylase-like metal-dependent hydrolase (beta-lactamase superfamily II)
MNTGGIASTNCYVLADESTKQAVLFDAPDSTVGPLLDEVERRGLDLIGLWLTHGHFDHVADHSVVTERYPAAQVLIHPLDAPALRDPRSSVFQLPFTIPPREPDGLLSDGQRLRIGSLDVEVIHTPGHSPGHVMFHLAGEETLVGGDLIICDAVGRTDLPGSDALQLDESIRKIMKLPRQTRLLPGHCEPTTLGEQLITNEYVRHALRGN